MRLSGKLLASATVALLLGEWPTEAQTPMGAAYGVTWTAQQWNTWSASKQDYPVPVATTAAPGTVRPDGVTIRLCGVNGQICASNGTAIRTITTGATDTMLANDGTIFWNSAVAGPKAETLIICQPSNTGQIVRIKDEKGTANSFNVVISAPGGGTTIDGGASFTMQQNRQSATLQCDGSSQNWNLL